MSAQITDFDELFTTDTINERGPISLWIPSRRNIGQSEKSEKIEKIGKSDRNHLASSTQSPFG